jgi:hypothetical protein
MTSNYPDVSERLSNTLATWQVLNFQHELEILALSTQGMASEEDVRACERHTKLPDTILGGTIETFDPADWQPDLRFIEIMPDNMRPCAAEALKNYQAFPYELFLWNVSSRRVFHLPHSLQAMLASAELPDIRWSDMLWPFDSFIISLEKPLVMTHPADGVEQRLDTVMVSRSKRLDGTPVVLFRLLHVPGKPGKRYGYTRKEVIEFRKLKRKRPAAAVKSMTRKLHELNRHNKNQQGSYNAVLRIGGHNDVIIVEPEALRISHGGVPDALAAKYVYELELQRFKVVGSHTTINDTIRVTPDTELYKKITASDHPNHEMLLSHLHDYHKRRDMWPALHDPLTTSVALGYDFVSFNDHQVEFNDEGLYRLSDSGVTVTNSDVNINNPEKFMKLMAELI